MEGGEARRVGGIDVGPKVNEAGDRGQGAGLLIVKSFDSKMKSGHSISVSQFLVGSPTKQEQHRIVLEPAERDSSSFQAF